VKKPRKCDLPKPPILEELERRVLFSADAAVFGLDSLDEPTEQAPLIEVLPAPDEAQSGSEQVVPEADAPAESAGSGLQLVLLDSRLSDVETLTDAVEDDATIILYDGSPTEAPDASSSGPSRSASR